MPYPLGALSLDDAPHEIPSGDVYPQEAALKTMLVKGIARERRAQNVRGDQLVDLYDAVAGQEKLAELQHNVSA